MLPVVEPVHANTRLIAIIGTVPARFLPEHTPLAVAFGDQVNGLVTLTIVDTRKSRLVRLPVEELHTVYHVGGQIAGGHFGVVAKERLAIQQHPLHIPSLCFHIAIAVYLHAGQFFQQIFDLCVGLCFERIGIELDRIAPDGNGRAFLHNNHFAQRLRLRLKKQRTQHDLRFFGRNGHANGFCTIPHKRNQ